MAGFTSFRLALSVLVLFRAVVMPTISISTAAKLNMGLLQEMTNATLATPTEAPTKVAVNTSLPINVSIAVALLPTKLPTQDGTLATTNLTQAAQVVSLPTMAPTSAATAAAMNQTEGAATPAMTNETKAVDTPQPTRVDNLRETDTATTDSVNPSHTTHFVESSIFTIVAVNLQGISYAKMAKIIQDDKNNLLPFMLETVLRKLLGYEFEACGLSAKAVKVNLQPAFDGSILLNASFALPVDQLEAVDSIVHHLYVNRRNQGSLFIRSVLHAVRSFDNVKDVFASGVGAKDLVAYVVQASTREELAIRKWVPTPEPTQMPTPAPTGPGQLTLDEFEARLRKGITGNRSADVRLGAVLAEFVSTIRQSSTELHGSHDPSKVPHQRSIMSITASVFGLDFDAISENLALREEITQVATTAFVTVLKIERTRINVTILRGRRAVRIECETEATIHQKQFILQELSTSSFSAGGLLAVLRRRVVSIFGISSALLPGIRLSDVSVSDLELHSHTLVEGGDDMATLGMGPELVNAISCTSGGPCPTGAWVDQKGTRYFNSAEGCESYAKTSKASCLSMCEFSNREGPNTKRCLCAESAICSAGQLCDGNMSVCSDK